MKLNIKLIESLTIVNSIGTDISSACLLEASPSETAAHLDKAIADLNKVLKAVKEARNELE